MPLLDKWTSGMRSLRAAEVVSPREQVPAGNRNGTAGIERSPVRVELPPPDVSARLCGAAGCTSSWIKPWKSRRRPIFEDEWGCSLRCMETIVAQSVRRESAAILEGAAPESHRHRVPLGLILLAQGWITHPQLQAALAAQRSTGQGLIGEWLIRHCGISEDRVVRGLAVQWNCPVLGMEGFSARAMSLVMPKRFVAEFGLLPMRVAGSKILYMAFQDRPNTAVSFSLEQMCGLKLEMGILTGTQFKTARSQLLGAESVPVRLKLVPDIDRMTSTIAKLLEQRQPVASRLVKVQQYYWLRFWLEEAALGSMGRFPASAEDMEDHVFMMS